MKKLILSVSAMLMTASMSMAQFVVTSTSVVYTGNSVPTTGANTFYAYQAYPASKFTEGTCTTAFTGTLGGFDPAQYDASAVTPPRSAGGVIFYGGTIANVYSGTPCVANVPSFGFNTAAVDLSLAANQKVSFDYQSDVALSLEFQLKDVWYNTLLSSVPFTLNGDGAVHTISLDFSSNVLGDVSAVTQVSLAYTSTTLSPAFGVSISNIKLGSAVGTTAIIDANGSVSSANLFPNPTSGLTTINAELKASSDVKVSLMDIYGKEVKTIVEGNYSSINTTFDASTIASGVYFVKYVINGATSKVERLVVR